MRYKLKKKEIQQIFQTGKRVQVGPVRAYYLSIPQGKTCRSKTQLICSVSKKTGFNAVLRNRYKRRLRAILRMHEAAIAAWAPGSGWFCLAIIYLGGKQSYAMLNNQLIRLLKKINTTLLRQKSTK